MTISAMKRLLAVDDQLQSALDELTDICEGVKLKESEQCVIEAAIKGVTEGLDELRNLTGSISENINETQKHN